MFKRNSDKPAARISVLGHILDPMSLFPGEDGDEYERHRRKVFADLNPRGHILRDMAERIARLDWRRNHPDIFLHAAHTNGKWRSNFRSKESRADGLQRAYASILADQLERIAKNEPENDSIAEALRECQQFQSDMDARAGKASPEWQEKWRDLKNKKQRRNDFISAQLAAEEKLITREEFLIGLDWHARLDAEIAKLMDRFLYLQRIGSATQRAPRIRPYSPLMLTGTRSTVR